MLAIEQRDTIESSLRITHHEAEALELLGRMGPTEFFQGPVTAE